MTAKRYLFAVILVLAVAACSDTKPGQSGPAMPDTPENRKVLAQRYLEISPISELLRFVASRFQQTIPEKDRQQFMEVMASPSLEKEANRLMLDGLVKHFTVAELKAMVDFYGSEAGKSAIKKLGPLMKEVMPQIQEEVKKAVTAMQKPPEPPKEQKKPEEPKKP